MSSSASIPILSFMLLHMHLPSHQCEKPRVSIGGVYINKNWQRACPSYLEHHCFQSFSHFDNRVDLPFLLVHIFLSTQTTCLVLVISHRVQLAHS